MKVLVPLVNGFEEIEAITIIDVLRRASIDVVTAGIPGTMIKGGKGVQIIADQKLDNINPYDFDAIILPGGPGYENLGQSEKVLTIIKEFEGKGKLVGAICAAPSVLAKTGILQNRKATIYPGMEKELPKYRDGKVVEDNNVITSQGPGTAMEFSLKIVEHLKGATEAGNLRRSLVC